MLRYTGIVSTLERKGPAFAHDLLDGWRSLACNLAPHAQALEMPGPDDYRDRQPETVPLLELGPVTFAD